MRFPERQTIVSDTKHGCLQTSEFVKVYLFMPSPVVSEALHRDKQMSYKYIYSDDSSLIDCSAGSLQILNCWRASDISVEYSPRDLAGRSSRSTNCYGFLRRDS